jgi:hypothetical protein
MRSTSFVVLSVVLVGSVFGQASAQCVDPFQQSFVAPVGSLYAEGNVLTTHFVAPQAITVSGDRAFVTGREAVMQKSVGVAAEYVRQPNGTWSAGVRIVGSPTINNSPEYFADRLALDGDRLVIGGSKIRNAWIYERTNGVWAQVAHFPEIGSGRGSVRPWRSTRTPSSSALRKRPIRRSGMRRRESRTSISASPEHGFPQESSRRRLR